MFIKEYLLFYINRVKEYFFFNIFLRKISYTVYRSKNKNELKKIFQGKNTENEVKIIGLNIPSPYFFEHIKDLWNIYKTNREQKSIIFGPIVNSSNSIESKFENYFNEKYDLILYKEIIPHAWAKKIKPSIILETALSTYAADVSVPRILYAHGMAGLNFSKDLYHVKYLDRYSALFLNGPMHRRAMLLAAKQYSVNLPEMHEIGYLRGDRLLHMAKTFDRDEYRKKYDLENLPIVIFAPTWGWFSALDAWFDSVIDVASSLDINLLLRLHPLTTRGPQGEYWKIRIEKVLKTHNRIRVEDSHNIDEILLAGDLLITDVSGLSMEFMTLNKPVTFLPAPLYFKLYGDNRPEKWILPKEEIKSNQDLKKSIIDNVIGKDSPINIDDLVYNSGNALPLMVSAIDDILQNNKI